MSSVLRILVLLCAFLSVTALAKSAPIETGFFNNDAIYGYDTVAYFTDNKAVKGSKKIQHEWRGAVWSFASEAHRDMFVADPLKYAPQFGGYCAYALADERLVGIDEDAFTIHDGKLYLNYSKGVMEDWRENMLEYIKKAQQNYPKLVELPPE